VLKRVILMGGDTQPGLLPYAKLIALGETVTDERLTARQKRVSPTDVAQMQFTSGTTGFPKGVRMTHHGMVNNARLTFARLGVKPGDRFVTPMPFFHVAGSLGSLLGPLTAGATLIPLISFEPRKQLQLMAQERATHTLGVPTMIIAMLNHPSFADYDLSSLRSIGSGGSPVPVSLLEQAGTRMNSDVWIIYGMTETHCTITLSRPDDLFELKVGTVGSPLTHTSVKIAHPQTGEPVGFGERGELCVSGFLVMKDYYGMSEKTRKRSMATAGCIRATSRR
jgi:acyl-CoA synthetase (AMP-forming)/AMP-acid ligase II